MENTEILLPVFSVADGLNDGRLTPVAISSTAGVAAATPIAATAPAAVTKTGEVAGARRPLVVGGPGRLAGGTAAITIVAATAAVVTAEARWVGWWW